MTKSPGSLMAKTGSGSFGLRGSSDCLGVGGLEVRFWPDTGMDLWASPRPGWSWKVLCRHSNRGSCLFPC